MSFLRFFRPRRLAAFATLALSLGAASGCRPLPPAPPATAPLAVLSPLPPELAAALATFRAEGPKGWAFTQTTSGEGRQRVERYDPRERGPARWTLLLEKGAAPTEEEQQRYRETRPLFDSSANLVPQLDRTSAAHLTRDEAADTYEFRLLPAGDTDTAAAHMRARFTLDRATGAFTRVEILAIEPFKPARSLTIHEARTTLLYSAPAGDRPALLREVSMHVSGERFWFRDFTQDVVSTFSDHENVSSPTPVSPQ